MSSIAAVGLAGIQQGLESAARNAEKASTALTEAGDGDLVTPLVGLTLDENQVKASATIVKVAEELDQTVLDIFA